MKSEKHKKTTRLHKINTDKTLLWSIISIAGMFYFLLLTPAVGYIQDDAVYMTLAKSIAHCNGYRLISSPQNLLYSRYPFIFPFLISPAFVFIDNIHINIIISEIISILLMLSFLVTIYFYIKLKSSSPLALCILFLTAFHHRTLFYFSSAPIMSEGCYALFVGIALLLFAKKTNLFFVIIPIILAFYTRTAGISLGISLLLYLLIKKRYKDMFVCGGIYFIFIFIWYWRSFRFGLTDSYFDFFFIKNVSTLEKITTLNDVLLRFFKNLWFCINYAIPDIIYPITVGQRVDALIQKISIFPVWMILRALFFSGIILIGFISKLREKITLLELYMIVYVGIVLFWPWTETRFIWPLTPFLFFYFWIGFKKILKNLKHYKLIILVGLPFFLLGTFSRHSEFLQIIRTPYFQRKDEAVRNYESAFLWIHNNASINSVLITGDASLFYLYTQKKCIGLDFSKNSEELMNYISQYSGEYLIVSYEYPPYMKLPYNSLLSHYKHNFKEVYQNKILTIYKIE